MSDLRDDLRLAWRRLALRPGFTAVAVLTLALGLGANTAIFTLIRASMHQQLPVDRPDDLVRLGADNNCCVNSGLQNEYSLFSTKLYEHLRDSTTAEFSDITGFQANTLPIGARRAGIAGTESFTAQYVAATYFRTLGVKPAAGRLFVPDDDRLDGPAVAVMSHHTWTRTYGQDPSVVNGQFAVNGKPVTIIGITASDFFGDAVRPNPPGLWLPLGHEPLHRGSTSLVDRIDSDWLYIIGRLRPGVPPGRVESVSTAALQRWLTAQSFVSEVNRPRIPEQRIVVAPAGGGVALLKYQFGRSLNILFVTSAFVLLIASANLANLLLARADRGQAAIRAALGASGGRLVRQAMTEGLVVAALGGLVAIALASFSARALVALAFPNVASIPFETTPSPLVMLFALGLVVVTGVLFTAAPAWAMSRTAPLEALSGVGRSGHQRSFVPRRSLVIVQVALSLVLLVGAGLLSTSLSRLEHQTLGFDPTDRTLVFIDPPQLAAEPDRLIRLYASIQERLRQIPGVVDATYALYSPMEGNNWSSLISIAGRKVDPAQRDSSSWNRVGPRFFETTGIKAVRGRIFAETDTPTSHKVAIINDAFRRRFFEKLDPIGQRVGIGDESHSNDFEIVGIVEDVKFTNASAPVRPMLFLPAFQNAVYTNPSDGSVQARSGLMRSLIVRTQSGVGTLEGQIRRGLAEVDPNLTVTRVIAHVAQVSGNFRMQRLMATLTSVYGFLALGLAALGLYGVTSYGVSQRTREIGVRMALGANRARIIRTVVGSPLREVLIGLAIGLPAAYVGTQVIATQLFEVGSRDPRIMAVASVILVAAAVIAAVLPAMRAAAIEPTKVLRGD